MSVKVLSHCYFIRNRLVEYIYPLGCPRDYVIGGRVMLTEPITVLPGVGKARAKLLEKLDLYTVQDVLFSYPRTYKDYSKC